MPALSLSKGLLLDGAVLGSWRSRHTARCDPIREWCCTFGAGVTSALFKGNYYPHPTKKPAHPSGAPAFGFSGGEPYFISTILPDCCWLFQVMV